MADEQKGKLSFNQSGQIGQPLGTGQAVQQPAAQPEGEGEGQPQYITVADFEKAKAELLEETARRMQSWSDKTQAKTQQMIDNLAKKGITITPRQAQDILESLPVETSDADTSKPAPAQAKGKGVEDTPPPVMQLAQSVLAKAGLTDKDFTEQEAEYINAAEDEVDFITRLKQAAQQKVAQRGSPSRTPAINTGSPSTLGGKDALTRELQTLLQNPLANRARLKEVKGLLAKYN